MPLNPNAASFVPFDKPPTQQGCHGANTDASIPSSVNPKGKNKKKIQKNSRRKVQNEGIVVEHTAPNEGLQTKGRKQNKTKQRNGTAQNSNKASKKRKGRQRDNGRKNPQNDDGNSISGEQQFTQDTSENVEASLLVGADAFPALGSTNPVQQESSANNQAGAAWSNAAVSTLFLSPVEPTAQEEIGDFVETSTGLKLTILGQEKTQNDPMEGTKQEVATVSQIQATNRDADKTEASEDAVAEVEKNPGSKEEDSLPPRLQAPQINMTRLRDKWWDALRLQAQKELEEEQLQAQRAGQDPSSPEDSSTEEEYVDTHPLAFNTGRTTGKAPERNDQMPMETELVHQYLQYSHPIHDAILNHDRQAMEALLRLPRNHTLDGTEKNLRRDITRLSPLQLAVKLDKPDLLRMLVRAANEEQEQARRNGNKTKGNWCLDNDSRSSYPTPLMMAVEMGHEECAQELLIQSVSSASFCVAAKDANGNNSLHYCCGTRNGKEQAGTPSILRALLGVVVDAGGTTPSKTLSAKNHIGQTAFHVACQQGRVELVEVFLDVCGSGSSFSVFVKLLSMKDHQEQTPLLSAVASGSTDLVMTLLMWKGNHHHHHMGTRQRQKASNVSIASSSSHPSSKPNESSPYCPLVWAIKTSANIDVVRLLLEFHTPVLFSKSDEEGQGYDLTLALLEAVARSASQRRMTKGQEGDCDEELLEIIEALIGNGANPCEERDIEERLLSTRFLVSKANTISQENESAASCERSTISNRLEEDGCSPRRASGASALTLAAALGHAPTLVALLDSLISQRKRTKESRRKDPILRNQQESFFRGIESIEQNEMQMATSDALVTSLFLGHKIDSVNGGRGTSSASSPKTAWEVSVEDYLSCSHALFLKGSKLGPTGMARLKCSLGGSILKRADEVLFSTSTSRACCHCYDFRASYRRDLVTVSHSNTAANSKEIKLSLKDRGELLFEMPWMEGQSRQPNILHCAWLKGMSNRSTKPRNDDRDSNNCRQAMQSDLVALVTDSGEIKVLAHGSVVSQQSAKLEAAIRFAKMSRDVPCTAGSMPEIDLGSTPTRLCLLMLQHLYLGSIVCGLPSDTAQCCQDLLDLLLLSEEFLCVSLMQECEMRLLCNNPWKCFCWSCNRATTVSATRMHENKTDECVYVVRGPPKLLTPGTVIDIVAVAQHLEEAQLCLPDGDGYDLDFAICLEGSRAAAIGLEEKDKSSWTSLPPNSSSRALAGLREVSMTVILSNFLQTLLSDGYVYQFEGDDGHSQKEASILLLRMCLDECAVSDFKEAWSVHALAMKGLLNSSSKPS